MNAETEAETEAWTPDDAASLITIAHARGVAPALEVARALLAPSRSGPPTLHDLPTICHPAMLTAETRFACVRDVWVAQTAWCVRPVGDWWLDAGMWLADESGGYCSDDAESDEFYNTYEADWLSSSSEEEGSLHRVLRRLRRREDLEDEEGPSTMGTSGEGE